MSMLLPTSPQLDFLTRMSPALLVALLDALLVYSIFIVLITLGAFYIGVFIERLYSIHIKYFIEDVTALSDVRKLDAFLLNLIGQLQSIHIYINEFNWGFFLLFVHNCVLLKL